MFNLETVFAISVYTVLFYLAYRYGYACGHSAKFDEVMRNTPEKPKRSIADTLTSLMGDRHDVYYPDDDPEKKLNGESVDLPFK